MISLINGKIIEKSENFVVVLTSGGVGYKVYIKPNGIDDFEIGKEYKILTHLIVREDIMDLYGFANDDEKRLFLLFLGVSGIGPKSALHLLSLGTVEEISSAISRSDVDYLTQVSGIGKKTAERLVMELKGKVGENVTSYKLQVTNNLTDVIDGLVAMGYSFQQAREAAKKLDDKNKTSEELMREALRAIN